MAGTGLNTLYNVLQGDPGAIALKVTEGGPALTRGALQQCVVDLARTLQQAGVRPGDVVSMAFTNTVSGCPLWRDVGGSSSNEARPCQCIIGRDAIYIMNNGRYNGSGTDAFLRC
jgi:hypothetical protein